MKDAPTKEHNCANCGRVTYETVGKLVDGKWWCFNCASGNWPKQNATPSSNQRVRLLIDIYDDGADHHPPGYIARKGEVLVVRTVRALGVSHEGVENRQFVVREGEFEVIQPDETKPRLSDIAVELRCKHAALLTEVCVHCEEVSEEGGERIVLLGPDGVLRRRVTEEPRETTKQLGLQVANGRLKAALIYACFAQHKTRQYMLPEGITLINGDAVEVIVNGVKVYAGPERSAEEPTRDDPNAPFRWICPKCTTVNAFEDKVCVSCRHELHHYHVSCQCPDCNARHIGFRMRAEKASDEFRPLCAHGNFADECPHPHTDVK